MSSKFRCAAAAALMAAAWPAVVAQPQATSAGAGSASSPAARAAAASAAPGAGTAYRSAFERYKRFDDQPVGSWRDANDTVGRIGGWQAYARDGQGGDAAEGTPMPAGHGAMGAMGHSSGAGSPAALMPAASSPGPSPAPVKLTPAGAAPARAPSGHSGHRMP